MPVEDSENAEASASSSYITLTPCDVMMLTELQVTHLEASGVISSRTTKDEEQEEAEARTAEAKSMKSSKLVPASLLHDSEEIRETTDTSLNVAKETEEGSEVFDEGPGENSKIRRSKSGKEARLYL